MPCSKKIKDEKRTQTRVERGHQGLEQIGRWYSEGTSFQLEGKLGWNSQHGGYS